MKSLCHVACSLVLAVGSALVCQSKNPGQPLHDVLSRVLLGVKLVSAVSSQAQWTLVTDSFVESEMVQSVKVTYFGMEIARARVQSSALSSLVTWWEVAIGNTIEKLWRLTGVRDGSKTSWSWYLIFKWRPVSNILNRTSWVGKNRFLEVWFIILYISWDCLAWHGFFSLSTYFVQPIWCRFYAPNWVY